MKRPGFREACRWIALNDDCSDMKYTYEYPSVTVCMVSDLFGVEHRVIIDEIRKEMVRDGVVFHTLPVIEEVENG